LFEVSLGFQRILFGGGGGREGRMREEALPMVGMVVIGSIRILYSMVVFPFKRVRDRIKHPRDQLPAASRPQKTTRYSFSPQANTPTLGKLD